MAEGIRAALPQEWDGSAIHPYRSVSIGRCRAKFSSIPNNRYRSKKQAGSANASVGSVDPSPAEETSALPEKENWQPHTVATRMRLGVEKILVYRPISVDRSPMSTVMEIEKAIEELPALEFRALAAWLEMRKSVLAGECAILSEKSLAVDWNRAEEDDAWQHLQSDQ